MNNGRNTDNANIHAGHRERVRENVTRNGYSQLEDHRLLELLLFFSIPRGDTNEIAHKLIDECGSLQGVLKATPERLKRVKGIGDNSAILIGALNEVYLRLTQEGGDGCTAYSTPESLSRLAASTFKDVSTEQIYLFCFDRKMNLKRKQVIADGDFNSVEIDLKQITKAVIGVNAVYVVIMHNHPNSNEQPSLSDIDATRNISVHLRKMSTYLVDHIIVGETGEFYSFKTDKKYSSFLM